MNDLVIGFVCCAFLDLAVEALRFFATFFAANALALAAFEALVVAVTPLVFLVFDASEPEDKSVGTPPANAMVEKLNMLGMIIHLIGFGTIAGLIFCSLHMLYG